jgi:hypothetical protein
MYFNKMELKAYYEMKKEEMEKAVIASKYSISSNRTKLYKNLLNMFKNKIQNKYFVPKKNCCDIKSQQVCCEN